MVKDSSFSGLPPQLPKVGTTSGSEVQPRDAEAPLARRPVTPLPGQQPLPQAPIARQGLAPVAHSQHPGEEQAAVVAARADALRQHRGTRTAELKLRKIEIPVAMRRVWRTVLDLPELVAYREAVRAASSDQPLAELRGKARGLVVESLGKALKATGATKVDQTLAALQSTGIDNFLVDTLATGRLTKEAVKVETDRNMAILTSTPSAERPAAAKAIKLGLVAFDEAAQRLGLAAGKGGSFRYPAVKNGPRDSLLAFARCLHR